MHVLPFMIVFWIVRAIYRWTQRSYTDGRVPAPTAESGASPAAMGMPPRPPIGDYRGDLP